MNEQLIGRNVVHEGSDGLRDTLFMKKQAEVIIGEYRGVPVAFALFFHNYSKSMDAEAMDEWTAYRLGKDALAALEGQKDDG